VPALAWKVGQKGVELAQRASTEGSASSLVEVLRGKPADDRVVAQDASYALAICVGSPDGAIVHDLGSYGVRHASRSDDGPGGSIPSVAPRSGRAAAVFVEQFDGLRKH
jgi:hypothetical protein